MQRTHFCTMGAVSDIVNMGDWARMRSLFHDGARLVPTGVRPTGEVGTRVLDVNGYIERSGA